MLPTITCISLADQHERRAFMKTQLDACGIPYRFMDAIRVDLKNGWPASYQREQRLRHSCIDLRAGEMGCYMSHRQVWQQFLQSTEELCFVLEDDVQLHADFAPTIRALIGRRDAWEFVRLFGMFKRPTRSLLELGGAHRLVDYDKQPSGMQGYLMNRAAAARLVDHTQQMIYPIDVAIDRDWEHGVPMTGVEPSVISHPELFETTLGSGQRVKLSLRQKLIREYYRVGPNIKKQIWIFKKRLHYRMK